MRLFINDEMVRNSLTSNILDYQILRFERKEISALGIGDASSGFCRVEWNGPESCMLNLLQNESLMGVLLPKSELRQARATFEEFFRGYKPKLPVAHLRGMLAANGLQTISDGNFEDDCPLCQLEREGKP